MRILKPALSIALAVAFATHSPPAYGQSSDDEAFVDLTANVVWDRIRGGLLGQMLGNLNGIPHEHRYISEPGDVSEYTPALPEGARTDDDTDFEWVYIDAMQRDGTLFLPPETIAELWKTRINRNIWCSNQYARVLMDLDLDPPMTGNIVLNPWAEFNISGQFLSETFGLIAPGMPQTAGRIGLHYTHVAIDGEPAQSTQLFTAMISTAFLTDDLPAILDAGVAALDSGSAFNEIIRDVRTWHREHPEDWRAARLKLKEKYSRHDGAMRDRNGYELNGASTIAAILYGNGDFAETLRFAFNFGWDADNNAATAGTIVGVMKGYRWMMSQEWEIRDRYANTTRDLMPKDETITSFADRLISLAEHVIAENGGQRIADAHGVVYRIPVERPLNVSPLPSLSDETERLQVELGDAVEASLLSGEDRKTRARAAYLAIATGLAIDFQQTHPTEWSRALEDLNAYPQVAQVLYHHSPVPAAELIREHAARVGFTEPERQGQGRSAQRWLWESTYRQTIDDSQAERD